MDILLVEDDAATRANLSDILELDGHRVLTARSLSESRKILSSGKICVVVLDRKLPDGTAEEFLPELRQLAPDAETIVVTGYADMDSTISALRQGVADYILKPINPDALRACLLRISDRRRIKFELQREQQFAGQIFQTAEAVILVLDLDGLVVRFNPYLQQISGWTFEELVGKNWFTYCIPERDHDWIKEVFLQTAKDAHSDGVVNSILTKDGLERWIRWSNTTLKDSQGRTTSVLAVGVDVTEFRAAQERAMRSERLAAIGQTMTALAHESRNALQRIRAGIELLALELQADHPAQRDLKSIERATNDLHQLLEEVRSFAAPIVLHCETTNIPDIWRRVWRQISHSREYRDVELVEHFAADIPMADVDVLRFEQVFRNLFDNSLEACHDPVKISVNCSSPSSELIEIVVRDNGPGLNSEQQKKAFDPFFTTKSEGTGLGMSIVQRIVEAHQGKIQIGETDSDEGKNGAVFVIQIPRHPII